MDRYSGIKNLEGEREKLLRMEEGCRNVVGQERPLSVSNAVRRARAGLSDLMVNGSFLFLGPLVW